jgi:hypothetical protein
MQKAEVTVHIWRPVEFNMGGRDVGKEKKVGEYYYRTSESSNILNNMLDNFSNEWQRMVGHASLSVRLANSKPLYLGFCPKNDDTKIILGSAAMNKKLGSKQQEGVFRKHLPEDMFYMTPRPKGETLENKVVKLSEEKKQLSPNEINKSVIVTLSDGSMTAFGSEFTYPDEEIQLLLPDGEAIYKHVSSVTKMKKGYDLLSSNCSTFVMEALQEGTRSLGSDTLKKIKAKGDSKTLEEFQKLIKIISAMAHAHSSAYFASETLKRLFLEDGVSLPNSLTSLFEASGKATPNTVKRYAEQLKKSIS